MLRDNFLRFSVVDVSITLAIPINGAFFTLVIVFDAPTSRADKIILISVFASTNFFLFLFDVCKACFFDLFYKVIVIVSMIGKFLVSSYKNKSIWIIINFALY